MKIVLATNNSGKLKELHAFLRPLSIHAAPQSDFNIQDADETGLTFVENAIIKARHAATHANLPALSDDSGLCVPALNGAPGIYSARYANGESDNITKLLHELSTVPENYRRAYFYCCLVFLMHAEDPTPIICEGRWHGIITNTQKGSGGFGYDPVFFISSLGKTAAELSLDEKNTISHRAIALKTLTEKLRELS